MSSDEIAISVENVAKCYEIYAKPGDRLKQFFVPRMKKFYTSTNTQYYKEFWALRKISFKIAKGETVGIIGKNGSGKSTLLQIICGTLSATSGEVKAHGRVAALLELGSGFNPEFSGRDNIYLNASVLGLSQEEIDAKYDDIVAFADIGQFIDQPVKTYSSGMVVRLAFAVQSQIDPDILIVDEALSVGDAKFQAKCFERLKRLKERGTSILLVTHSSEQIVTHCNRAILINEGSLIDIGEPRSIVNKYLDILFGRTQSRNQELQDASAVQEGFAGMPADSAPVDARDHDPLNFERDVFYSRIGYNHLEYRWGDGAASILDFELWADDEKYPSQLKTGQTLRLRISIKFHRELFNPILGLTIKTKEGVTVYGVNSESLRFKEFEGLGECDSTCSIEMRFKCLLASGDYFVSLGLASRGVDDVVPHDRRYDSIHLHVSPDTRFHGLVDLGLVAQLA